MSNTHDSSLPNGCNRRAGLAWFSGKGNLRFGELNIVVVRSERLRAEFAVATDVTNFSPFISEKFGEMQIFE